MAMGSSGLGNGHCLGFCIRIERSACGFERERESDWRMRVPRSAHHSSGKIQQNLTKLDSRGASQQGRWFCASGLLKQQKLASVSEATGNVLLCLVGRQARRFAAGLAWVTWLV